MGLGFSTKLRTARAFQTLYALDAGPEPGTLDLFGGKRPETGAALTDQVHLSGHTLSRPSGRVADGILVFHDISEGFGTSKAGKGTDATWCRFRDGSGLFVMDGSVTAKGRGGEIQLNSTTIATGSPVKISPGGMTIEGNF